MSLYMSLAQNAQNLGSEEIWVSKERILIESELILLLLASPIYLLKDTYIPTKETSVSNERILSSESSPPGEPYASI